MADRFEINSTAPPAGSEPRAPVEGGSYERFILPDPTGLSGEGVPVGAVGYPQYEIFFDYLPLAGWTFYAAFTGEAPYASLTSLKLWQPYASSGVGAWTTYAHAIMHRPFYERMAHGGQGYENVAIRFTELY